MKSNRKFLHVLTSTSLPLSELAAMSSALLIRQERLSYGRVQKKNRCPKVSPLEELPEALLVLQLSTSLLSPTPYPPHLRVSVLPPLRLRLHLLHQLAPLLLLDNLPSQHPFPLEFVIAVTSVLRLLSSLLQHRITLDPSPSTTPSPLRTL